LFLDLRKQDRKQPWGSYAVSFVAQAVGLAALLIYSIVSPKFLPPQTARVELIAPDLMQQAPPPVVPIKVMRALPKFKPETIVEPVTPPKIQPPPMVVHQPQRIQRAAAVPEVLQPQAPAPKFDSKVLNDLPGAKLPKVIATNTFGSSATPTLPKMAPSKVQTGGFGDPNGIPANAAHGSNHPNIAAAGSFNLPQGEGYGNGSGGAKGARGTIASAGFGNGIATEAGNGGRGGHIQSTGFTTAVAAPPSADERRTRALNNQVTTAPVLIQSKPKPVYTSEARELRVEGEVLLNVVFTAQGQIHILNVVRGLGHGLDEAAERAAQGVKFSPAIRDGRPVDSNATLHIVFQIS
jgi:TonB family protein